MAEKTLNTRILLRNGKLSEWNPDFELKVGEVALVRVDTAQPDGHGGIVNVPTYLMKVGAKKEDGNLYKFSELNWLAAPASDVHAWAKATTKPTYDGTEINVTLGSGEEATTKSVAEFIATLSAAVGEGGSVSGQISSAISAALESLVHKDEGTGSFVTAVTQSDGAIEITRRNLTADDIPALEIKKITGLEDALNLRATAADLTALKETVQGTDGNGGLKQDLADEISDRETADNALGKRIDDLTAEIGNVSNIMNFVGVAVITETEKTLKDAAAKLYTEGKSATDGDVIICGDKEYVYSDNNWIEFGDASGNANAITALDTRVDTAEQKIAALEELKINETYATKTELTTGLAGKVNNIDFNEYKNVTIQPIVDTVGNNERGLVKEVADLKATVGDDGDGLVKEVNALKAASSTYALNNDLVTERERINAVYSRFGTDQDVLILNCGTATTNW